MNVDQHDTFEQGLCGRHATGPGFKSKSCSLPGASWQAFKQMYECRAIVKIALLLKHRPCLRNLASFCLSPGSLHQPLALSRLRKLPATAQHAHSRSQSAGAEAPFQHKLHEQRRSLSNTKDSLNASQLLQAQQFLELLMKQNATMNLTAAADEEEAFRMHVEDSLALLPTLDTVASQQAQILDIDGRPQKQEFSIIDVGSGGGLPGIIIAIARPHWKVTLLDSLRKRCHFVEKAVQHIGLQNTEVVWARAEEAGQSQRHREVYNVAIARAVARMRVLSELCLPMVKPGGHWLAAKGPDCQAEVAEAAKAIAILQGKLVSISHVNAFGSVGQHMAVLVKKIAPTPAQYPRQPGKPSKRPL